MLYDCLAALMSAMISSRLTSSDYRYGCGRQFVLALCLGMVIMFCRGCTVTAPSVDGVGTGRRFLAQVNEKGQTGNQGTARKRTTDSQLIRRVSIAVSAHTLDQSVMWNYVELFCRLRPELAP